MTGTAGLGHVCTFSLFDMRQHGHPDYVGTVSAAAGAGSSSSSGPRPSPATARGPAMGTGMGMAAGMGEDAMHAVRA